MEIKTDNSVGKLLTDGAYDQYSALLDIGCGYGEDIHEVWELCGARMFGFDKDETKITKALQQNPRAMLQVSDAEEMIFPDGSFDGILMKQSLSEINMQKDALYLARCALKENGRLYIADYYLRTEDPKAVAAAKQLAENAEQNAILYGNCESRRVKRPSYYCVGRAFIKSKLLELLELVGLQPLSWEDVSFWKECGSLAPTEGYFFLTAVRKKHKVSEHKKTP